MASRHRNPTICETSLICLHDETAECFTDWSRFRAGVLVVTVVYLDTISLRLLGDGKFVIYMFITCNPVEKI